MKYLYVLIYAEDGERRYLNNLNKARVLIVDGNDRVTKFLKLNLENAGYDVAVLDDLEGAVTPEFHMKVDLVALASHLTEGAVEAVSKLRKALGCPVLVYGMGNYSREERRALNIDHWIDRFYESAEFLKAVKTALENKPKCGT